MTGIVVLAVALVAAAGFGVLRYRTDGRFGTTTATPSAEWGRIADALAEAELGERATLVQFSSAFCAPCRATRVVLADVAQAHPGIAHLEIDAELHLDLVRALDVRRTPTTLVLGPDGRELGRAAGAPTRDQVLAALPVTTA